MPFVIEIPLLNGTLFKYLSIAFRNPKRILLFGLQRKLAEFVVKFFVFDFVEVVLRNFSLRTSGYWKKKTNKQTKKRNKKKRKKKATSIKMWVRKLIINYSLSLIVFAKKKKCIKRGFPYLRCSNCIYFTFTTKHSPFGVVNGIFLFLIGSSTEVLDLQIFVCFCQHFARCFRW